jgi:hypothetical protein
MAGGTGRPSPRSRSRCLDPVLTVGGDATSALQVEQIAVVSFRSFGAPWASDSSALRVGIGLIENASSILTGISPQPGPGTKLLSCGSTTFGIGLRFPRRPRPCGDLMLAVLSSCASIE